ncbi:TPA: hypothetical protein RQK73_003413 [Vibrio vulnificus]|nr:hypothetical protein [Vibrio vulnificus]
MKIINHFLVFYFFLLLSGCKESEESEVQQIFSEKLILSQHEMVSFSEIVNRITSNSNPNESIELEIVSGKEFAKKTNDKKIVALKDGEVQLKNRRNGHLYYLKIDSNDVGADFLNLTFIDLETGVVLTDDVLTVGHRYGLGMSSRFPLKQSDVQIETTNGKLVQRDAVGNIFITPTKTNGQDGSNFLIKIKANGREYAKYFRIREEKIMGSRLITDSQKRFFPVGAKVVPSVSYQSSDGKVRSIRAELLTYVIEGKELSLSALQDYLANPNNKGRHQISVKYPDLVEASLNYEMVTLSDFVAMFGITVNLPNFPNALKAHVDIPYRLLVTSNGIDVTSLVEFEVSPSGGGRIEDGYLMVSNNEITSLLLSVSINGNKLSSYIPNKPDYYRVNVDKTELSLNLDVADSLLTKQGKNLPARLLLNDVNVAGRNLGVKFVNSTGERLPGSEGRKGWSTCSLSFSEPRATVLFDDKIYGVPEKQTHGSLFTFDCRERNHITPHQAIDFVAISSLEANEVISRYGAPLLNHPEVNGVYKINYDKLGQNSVQVDVSLSLNDIFNHPSRNKLKGQYTIAGSDDLIIDTWGNLTFLGSFQPSTLTLQLQGEPLRTYNLEVDYNTIGTSGVHVYNQNHGFVTIPKNIEIDGIMKSFENVPYLAEGIPLTVSTLNERGENVDITPYIRLRAASNRENDALRLHSNQLFMNIQGAVGQYRFDLLDKDFRQEFSSIIFDVVDRVKMHKIRGPHLNISIPVGSLGRLAFKRKVGPDYEINFNRTTSFLRSYQYMSTMYGNIFSKSGGNILPIDIQTNELNTIGSAYRNGFAISESLMTELEQPVQYDFEIIGPSGNVLFSSSR